MRALTELANLLTGRRVRGTHSRLTASKHPAKGFPTNGDGATPDLGTPTHLRIRADKKSPYNVPPADTDFEYAYPLSAYSGPAAPAAAGLRSYQRLRYGRVVSAELEGIDGSNSNGQTTGSNGQTSGPVE